MGKRKLEDDASDTEKPAPKKSREESRPSETARTDFRTNLFDSVELDKSSANYAESEPYKHGVISNLINDGLLRAVRREVIDQISFAPKETDIYKIHQSGDLANLDGLDDDSLKQLPSLLKLRNAMYSASFRVYLSGITDSGPLSGKKTDMAINVYTPGSHLLCHDDVIGTRRVSYILYLTDPDNPWQPDWGGALRLYPTTSLKQIKGPKLKSPAPDFTRSIPPAWNQLSFFAVQPGESFHDVEEVYSAGDAEEDKKRVRMAISGWYHIPQEGEEGYRPGMEEELAASSSLTQLQTKDNLDLPKTVAIPYPDCTDSVNETNSKETVDEDSDNLTVEEFDFLLQFMSADFLMPDMVSKLSSTFGDTSSFRIDGFLSADFAKDLLADIKNQPRSYETSTQEIESSSSWTVARPPHKHRYLFLLPSKSDPEKPDLLAKESEDTSALKKLLSTYLPNLAFRKWLRAATGLVLRSYDLKARRFRRGQDYQLATAYTEENPRLEMTLGISPEGKWETEEQGEAQKSTSNNDQAKRGEEINNGGDEVWMVGEDDQGEHPITAVEKDTDRKSGTQASMTGSRPKIKPKSVDPAVYQSSQSEDSGILFSMPAGWNRLSLVLRDSGTLRFVKYVSRSAGADRWDVVGDWDVDWDATPEIDGDENDDELARELEDDMEEFEKNAKEQSIDDEDDSDDETEKEDDWSGFPDSQDNDDGYFTASQETTEKSKAFMGRRR